VELCDFPGILRISESHTNRNESYIASEQGRYRIISDLDHEHAFHKYLSSKYGYQVIQPLVTKQSQDVNYTLATISLSRCNK
jgi:hypothetical protein